MKRIAPALLAATVLFSTIAQADESAEPRVRKEFTVPSGATVVVTLPPQVEAQKAEAPKSTIDPEARAKADEAARQNAELQRKLGQLEQKLAQKSLAPAPAKLPRWVKPTLWVLGGVAVAGAAVGTAAILTGGFNPTGLN